MRLLPLSCRSHSAVLLQPLNNDNVNDKRGRYIYLVSTMNPWLCSVTVTYDHQIKTFHTTPNTKLYHGADETVAERVRWRSRSHNPYKQWSDYSHSNSCHPSFRGNGYGF